VNRAKSSGVQLVFRFNKFVSSRCVSARVVTACSYACFAASTADRAVRADFSSNLSHCLKARGADGRRGGKEGDGSIRCSSIFFLRDSMSE